MPARKKRAARPARRWSKRVTETSNALDLEKDAAGVARSLKRSADRSRRRKSGAYRSAISMLTFYMNRAGKNLPATRRRVLDAAKDELRRLYGCAAAPVTRRSSHRR
jgi:hypothetical protein